MYNISNIKWGALGTIVTLSFLSYIQKIITKIKEKNYGLYYIFDRYLYHIERNLSTDKVIILYIYVSTNKATGAIHVS